MATPLHAHAEAADEPAPSDTVDPAPDDEAARGPSVLSLPLATLRLTAPLQWLRLGWADFKRCPRIGLFYGLCFFAMGHALLALFQKAPEYLLALSAGFLLMGPFLCLGLYDASKAMQTHSHRPSLRASLQAWRPTRGTMAIFAGVLLILEMLWGRAALVVFAVSFNTMPDKANLLAMLLDPENIGFVVTYCVVGGVFASLIFVTSVISIPMIMDRQVDAVSAGLTSIRACLQNPGVMLFWGALITGIIVIAMLPAFLGLLIAGPVIGHATWHAYRHIVPTA
ncbi:MAG: DUF2189 domain-containing protein [Hydrogenophaga sp.]|uniref:DUF2189 domain-containing protein n=1 Tax=Hydrogenophaga sp. TaxID=1904254 RepID=UPI0025C4F060|nr:DUF2189 domain-containing protein [Hydrogenophaga sp.]MBT9550493.1 DUF2189 domain-containing protein [Hydrogenophaga sp.]